MNNKLFSTGLGVILLGVSGGALKSCLKNSDNVIKNSDSIVQPSTVMRGTRSTFSNNEDNNQ